MISDMDEGHSTRRLSERLQEAQHLQMIEGNALSDDELAMFEMFEREGWSHERRRAYILAQFQVSAAPAA